MKRYVCASTEFGPMPDWFPPKYDSHSIPSIKDYIRDTLNSVLYWKGLYSDVSDADDEFDFDVWYSEDTGERVLTIPLTQEYSEIDDMFEASSEYDFQRLLEDWVDHNLKSKEVEY